MNAAREASRCCRRTSTRATCTFTPTGEAIRFGLGAVKNVGQGAVEAIAKARDEGGPFTSIFNFCDRVNLGAVNHRVVESLIKAGAMDSLAGNRAQLTKAIDRAVDSGMRASRDRELGQGGLFGFVAEEEGHAEQPLVALPDWTMEQKLAGEKEMLGIYVSGHPLDRYADKISELATHTTDNLDALPKHTEVALCGVLSGITRKRNKEGKPWVAMTLEDRTGNVEALLFTTSYERLAGHRLVEDQAVLVRALVLPEEGGAAKDLRTGYNPARRARVDFPSVISIRVWIAQNGALKAQALQDLFTQKPGPTQVRFRLEAPTTSRLLWTCPRR